MKVAVALIAGTAQARVKEFCPLKQVPSDYECIRGPAGMWECSRECPHGAGKLHMDCECGPLHGCHWNDFGGRCIEDNTVAIKTPTSTTTTSTTTSTTATSTTTTDDFVYYADDVSDLSVICPTDSPPDHKTWMCSSQFTFTSEVITCRRLCQDISTEVRVCNCSGAHCKWEIEAECNSVESMTKEEAPTTTLEQQTTTLESTTSTALHTSTELTTMRPKTMMMDAIEDQVKQEEEEAEEAEEPEEPVHADEVEPDDKVTEDADDQDKPTQSYPEQTNSNNDHDGDQDEENQAVVDENQEGDVTQQIKTEEGSARKKPPTDQSVIKLELDNVSQDDLDVQTSGNPFSGFLQSLQQFAKMTLVSIDEGFVQPVRHSLSVGENPK